MNERITILAYLKVNDPEKGLSGSGTTQLVESAEFTGLDPKVSYTIRVCTVVNGTTIARKRKTLRTV